MRTAKYWHSTESLFDKHRLTIKDGERELVLCRESHHISTPDHDWARATMEEVARVWEASDVATATAGSAATEIEIEIGEMREKATIGKDGILSRGFARFEPWPTFGDLLTAEFGRDLVRAHNAYFSTDPEGDAKLDRELGQALKADAEKRAKKAAVAICDAMLIDPSPAVAEMAESLVASIILVCQR